MKKKFFYSSGLTTMMNETEDLVKKSKILLFQTLNCCESQIVPIKAIYDVTNQNLRKSVTGLAGGINNNGSTCGVVFGGALNLAIIDGAATNSWNVLNEIDLIYNIQKFVNLFEQKFGSSLCRERTCLDLRKVSGKIGLLIPSKVKGCVKQTAWTMNYITETKINSKSKSKINSPDSAIISIDHCSTAIFEEIKKRTGINDPYLQQLSTGLSGGIGLSGGGCAALSAGIMLLGLKYGNKDLKEGKRRNPLRWSPPKFVKYANRLINLFKKKFGSLECRDITSTKFTNIENFNEYRAKGRCNEINKLVIDFTSKILLDK
ncbi:MAG: C-GCAxxG-C-C family protein [Promethearchaeota archaeon]